MIAACHPSRAVARPIKARNSSGPSVFRAEVGRPGQAEAGRWAIRAGRSSGRRVRHVGLEQSGRRGEPVARVHRNRPIARVDGHPFQPEFVCQVQDGGDESAAQPGVSQVRYDVHALYVARRPTRGTRGRHTRHDRQPRHPDHHRVADHDDAPVRRRVVPRPRHETSDEFVVRGARVPFVLQHPPPPQLSDAVEVVGPGRTDSKVVHGPILARARTPSATPSGCPRAAMRVAVGATSRMRFGRAPAGGLADRRRSRTRRGATSGGTCPSQRTTKGREKNHSLPPSTYNALGVLRQAPGRTAEFAGRSQYCRNVRGCTPDRAERLTGVRSRQNGGLA
jgi:hypothetical protein